MTGPAIDHVLGFLIPIFLAGAGGDHASARAAALQLLESHGTADGRELLLSAEIIALSFATLDNLGKSVADPQLSITARLRLRSNANALSRAADRARQGLARARTPAAEPAVVRPEPGSVPDSLPVAVQKVRDAIVQAAPRLAETLTQSTQPMSRQQRRFLTRKAEKAQAAREREARRSARLAERGAARTKDSANPQQTDTSQPAYPA